MNPQNSETDDDHGVDLITNSSMPHPAGTGIGAVGGALAGAAAGSAGGPLGTAVGAVVGAVVGGAAGHVTAAAISPTEEELYWSENHSKQPYADEERTFEDYRPAYRMGAAGPTRYGPVFESAEETLQSDWGLERGPSTLEWTSAKPAVRAAWDRASRRSLAAGSSEGARMTP
jgi:hypothetical protein